LNFYKFDRTYLYGKAQEQELNVGDVHQKEKGEMPKVHVMLLTVNLSM
jgi:hypothetical protein